MLFRSTTASDGFNPRILASYEVNDQITLNAQASQGFRLGGVNDPLNGTLCSPADLTIFGGFQSYDDETLWNYEAGFKAQTGNVTFNSAVFYNDISDLQVTLDAGTCSSRVVFNVPDAHSAGLEWELGWSPSANLDLSFAGTLIESKFDSTVVDGTGTVIGGIRDGNRLPSTPETQFAVSGYYHWAAPWVGNEAEAFVSGSLQYIGTQFTQPSDQEPGGLLPTATGLARGVLTGAEDPSSLVDLELDSYSTVNVSAGLDFGDWSVTGYINNLTGEDAVRSEERRVGKEGLRLFRSRLSTSHKQKK